MLKVQRLNERALLPTVAHKGEDLGYDLFALDNTVLYPFVPTVVSTGIAAQAFTGSWDSTPCGLLIRDRSSMAKKGIITVAGVVDHGYTGEIGVMMIYIRNNNDDPFGVVVYQIRAGDKIAQMIPVPLLTGDVEEVPQLNTTTRGADGYGSTGAAWMQPCAIT